MDFKPFELPSSHEQPPATGYTTDRGVTWHGLISGLNERFKHLFEGGSVSSEPQPTVESPRLGDVESALAEANGRISELSAEVVTLREKFSELEALVTAPAEDTGTQGSAS